MKKFRVGVIGGGSIARVGHVPGYAAEPDYELVAIADPNPDSLAKMRENFSFTREYADYREMLKQEQLDLVSICLPNKFHADAAIAAMAAGADIILEKPVALTEAEGAAIAAASRQYQKQIAVCFSYRFSALVQAAKAAVEAGEIGNLYMIRVRFAHQGPIPGWATTDWFYDPELAGGGAVLDMGIHAIDLVRHLAGEITEVSAFAGTLRKPIKLEDNLVAIFRLAGPCFGYIESGWTSAAGFNGIELMGDKGEITVNYSTNQATVTTGTIHPDGTTAMTTRIIAENGESPWKIQMREFLAAYRDGRPLAPTIDDGVTALKIALAAYQASATGKSVKF